MRDEDQPGDDDATEPQAAEAAGPETGPETGPEAGDVTDEATADEGPRYGKPLLAAGLVALALLVGPGAWVGAGEVGRVSAARATGALTAIGADWARVEADGLRLSLLGAYPDTAAHGAALAALAGASPLSRIADDAARAAPSRGGPAADPAPRPAPILRQAQAGAPVLLAAAGDAATATTPILEAAPDPAPRATATATEEAEAGAGAKAEPGPDGGAEATPPAPVPPQPGQAPAAATAAAAPTADFGSPLTLARSGDSLVAAGAAHPDLVAALREALAAIDGAPELADATVPRRSPPDPERLALARAAIAAVAALGDARAELAPGVLSLSALAPSRDAADAATEVLRAAAPEDTTLLLDISAPPPVLSPFRFGVSFGPSGPALLSCDMRSEAEGREVLAAFAELPGAETHGSGERLCRLGVGAPSQRWGEAAAAGVRALGALGAGRFEIIDAEARLVAAPSVGPGRFSRVARALAAELPPSFALHLTPPPPRAGPRMQGAEDPEDEGRAPRWLALRRDENGAVTLGGGAPDAASRAAVAAYARARFGAMAVDDAMSLAEAAPPPTWRRAALAGIDALRPLDRGALRYDGEAVRVEGASLRPAAAREADAALAPLRELGLSARSVVTVDLPALAARLPLPGRDCLISLAAEVAADPIGFAPGETSIEAGSGRVLDRLAAILTRCSGLVVEIGGHTDSQGRESTNQRLSQGRAEAVLDALHARGVPLSRMVAQGYGESRPIADNGDEAGRAANRRIEFSDAAMSAATLGEGGTGPENGPDGEGGG